jgi:hypothetical protein
LQIQLYHHPGLTKTLHQHIARKRNQPLVSSAEEGVGADDKPWRTEKSLLHTLSFNARSRCAPIAPPPPALW